MLLINVPLLVSGVTGAGGAPTSAVFDFTDAGDMTFSDFGGTMPANVNDGVALAKSSVFDLTQFDFGRMPLQATGGASFDGSDDNLSGSIPAAFGGVFGGDFRVATNFTRLSNQLNTTVFRMTAGGAFLGMDINGTTLRFRIGDGSTSQLVEAAGALNNVGVSNNVAFELVGTTINIYKDDVVVQTATFTPAKAAYNSINVGSQDIFAFANIEIANLAIEAI